MRVGKVDFPGPLVAAARNHELVVFAGAGVSMGKLASLPGFRKLAERVAKKAGEDALDIKKVLDRDGPDVYLGRLKGRGTDVHALAAEMLTEASARPADLHQVLLSLYPEPNAVRVVTTNFDRLFEQAVKAAFPEAEPATWETRSFPDLPPGRDFRGIVHLHGDVEHFSDMVLTDEDFGAAYLGREPRAQRFVIDLLSTNTLLFVGYSGDDVIFRYLTRGLSSAEGPRHFVMTRAEDEQAWRELGVEPVFYPTSPGDPEASLCESLSRLVQVVGARVSEQKRRVEKLAGRLPSELSREETDLVADALSDSVRRKFFTRAATSPDWIVWLDERGYLDALFCDEELSESDRELARWLARSFVPTGSEELFALISGHEVKLHAEFWHLILRQAGMSEKSSVIDCYLSRWVSLLLSAVPSRRDRSVALDLFLLGERCIENELTDSAAEIFETLAASQLILKRPLPRPHEDGESNLGINVEFSPIGGSYELNELWRKGLWRKELLSNRHQIASRILPVLVENLAKQNRTLRVWGKADQSWDPVSFNRSAIEPHDQDRYPRAIDAVIDAARDCLQWLAEHERDVALHWWRQLTKERAPVLRRLAMHTLAEIPDAPGLGPDEKIDRLLSCGAIRDDAVHHEVFRAMQLVYPSANRQRRQAVIDAVLDFQMSRERDPDGERSAYARFNWFHWLYGKAPDCDLAEKARDKVQEEHPGFQPRPYPDLKGWRITDGIAQSVELHSPWSADQLLEEPAERWVSRLIEYRPEGFSLRGFPWERKGLLEQVVEAAKKDFNWGADLADALARDEEWEIDLWGALLQAWAEADEEKIRGRHALQHLSQGELYSEHFAAIADLLYAWVRSGKHVRLLVEADRIAVALWPIFPRDTRDLVLSDGVPDWMTTAINRPSGILAQFWLERFLRDGLHGECEAALSAIACDPGIPGRLGRTALAYGFPVLLDKEQVWTQEHLLPFFEWQKNKDIEDCQAVWDGFLHRPYIDCQMFSLMESAFHAAIERLQDERCFLMVGLRKQFLSVCAMIVTDKHIVPDPLDKWLPSVLQNCSVRDMRIFIAEIGQSLEKMSEEEQEESWRRWLEKYWRLRRHGAIAGSLTREETTGMFHWLPCLRGVVFAEAVDLAEQTSPAPDLRHSLLFHELDEAELCRKQPEAVARLLLCLDKAESPRYAWWEGEKLIRELLTLEIPAALQSKLKDLAELRDISVAEESAA